MTYLALLSTCLAIAIALQFTYKIRLYHSYKQGILFTLLLLAFFIPLDIYAVAHNVLRFPGDGILGLYIFNLPLEEYIFMLVIPYFVLVVYKLVDMKFSSKDALS